MTEVVNRTLKEYVLAANEPSYYKTVKKEGGNIAQYQSNPDKVIFRTHEATEHIEAKDWGVISNHRPVTSTIKAKLRMKELRIRVSK